LRKAEALREMGMNSPEIVKYPMFDVVGLEVDERYRAIQEKGLIKVRLPHGEPCWLATRYHDVRTVYGQTFNRKTSLTRDAPGMFPSVVMRDPTLLVNMDPPEQTRLRRLTAAAFSQPRIQQMHDAIEQFANELLDAMEAKGKPGEFIANYARILPVRVLSEMLGVPRDQGMHFSDMVEISSNQSASEDEKNRANSSTREFVQGLIAARRNSRTGDILSDLVEARDGGDKLSESELISLAFSLWHGGFKTTWWQLGSTFYTLMTRRHLWEEIKRDPEILQPALVELWRWIPSFKYGWPFVRYANEDTEFSCGAVVRAGEPVLGELAVANRDERVFPNAWEIDFHREDPMPTLIFAYGAHTCVGQHLARLQVKTTVEIMLDRYPDLELAVPEADLTWSPNTPLRSINALPLRW
jgi:cytochrome P450